MPKKNLIKVLVGGVFDFIHLGHIHTLNAAKELGDELIVVIANDKTIEKIKKPIHNQNQRKELVEALKMVDKVIIGNENDIYETIKKVKPQIIAIGYDQKHDEKKILDMCKKLNIDVEIKKLNALYPDLSSRNFK